MQQYSLSLESEPLNAGALLVREADGAVRAASLPRDYSQMQVAPELAPVLGDPLPGDFGRPVLRAEREAGLHAHGGPDAAEVERLARLKEAEEAARSPLFYKASGRGADDLAGRGCGIGRAGESPGRRPHHHRRARRRDGAQDSINQVGQQMTRRNMNIQPTLTIRQGMPVQVVATRDITLRPYRPLFINR